MWYWYLFDQRQLINLLSIGTRFGYWLNAVAKASVHCVSPWSTKSKWLLLVWIRPNFFIYINFPSSSMIGAKRCLKTQTCHYRPRTSQISLANVKNAGDEILPPVALERFSVQTRVKGTRFYLQMPYCHFLSLHQKRRWRHVTFSDLREISFSELLPRSRLWHFIFS